MSAVVIVGMIAGSVLVLAAAYVFVKNKDVSAGGVGVTLVGLLLIGMSQWSTIEIEGGGFKIKALRDAIAQTAAAADTVAAEAEQAAAGIDATRRQLASLTREIENRGVLVPAVTRPIQSQLSAVPAIDRTALERARANLRRLSAQKP